MDTIDNLNSSSSLDDEMNMMLMMMQLPEFSSPHGDDDDEDAVAFFQPLEFSLAATSTSTATTSTHSTMPQANSLDNPPMHWSSFTHLPSTTISFTNNPTTPTTPMLQEQDQTPPTMLSNSATIGALSGAYAFGTVSSDKRNSVVAKREMILRIAAMQAIHIDPESVKPPKRKNVKISKDPRSVAARHRRERIRERIRILQRLVPGGSKMDTASMLDEAIHYVKFLKSQVQSLERVTAANSRPHARIGFPVSLSSGSSGTATSYLPLSKPHQASQIQSVVLLRDA